MSRTCSWQGLLAWVLVTRKDMHPLDRITGPSPLSMILDCGKPYQSQLHHHAGTRRSSCMEERSHTGSTCTRLTCLPFKAYLGYNVPHLLVVLHSTFSRPSRGTLTLRIHYCHGLFLVGLFLLQKLVMDPLFGLAQLGMPSMLSCMALGCSAS